MIPIFHSTFLLDKGGNAENLQKECLCYFISFEIRFALENDLTVSIKLLALLLEVKDAIITAF